MRSNKKRQPKAPAPPSSSSSSEAESADEEKAMDYGATADAYAADHSDHNLDEEEEEETSLEYHDEEAHNDDDDEEDSSSDDKDEEEASDDEDDDEEHNDQEGAPQPTRTSHSSDDACWFDLRNLTAVHSHPLEETALYPKTSQRKTTTKCNNNTNDCTIDGLGNNNTPDESYLLQHATTACTQLIAALWDLPTERSDAGPLVTLPTYDAVVVPRALPPPPPKTETKWERFAKERGINVNNEKRSRKVWDDTTGEWKYRTGRDSKAKAQSGLDWPILEVKPGQDPMADPWERLRDEKFQRQEQNRSNQLGNQERAGTVPKGTTRRVIRSKRQARQAGKDGGGTTTRVSDYRDQSLPMAAPAGVPVDMTAQKLRGKTSTVAAIKATQVSTASLGKFDKMRQGEPARRKGKTNVTEKRKLLLNNNNEAERSAKVLKTVLAGDGGVANEKARKAGKLARGLTAYDYEYDDGSNRTFQKKKGRAGMGKNRKMTKKRIK